MQKIYRFSVIRSILLLLPEVLGIFQRKKKHPPRNQWKSYQKNFQPDRTLNSPEKGGETIHRFLTLRSLEVDEDEVW
jgi:hypothetical protein